MHQRNEHSHEQPSRLTNRRAPRWAVGPLKGLLTGLLLGTLGGALLVGCGGQVENLVTVRVGGIDRSITELFVTMQINGRAATNPNPQSSESPNGFVVYEDMQRFGVQVPNGTVTLEVNLQGYNTNRAVVATGSGSTNPATRPDLDITLTAVPAVQ